jgi:hypothetical protein
MTFTVVGCGPSAALWEPNGISIGSNDCEKFGRPVDHLVLANAPRKFVGDRFNVTKRSKAQVHTTSRSQWFGTFPRCLQLTRVVSFNTRILNGYVYTSRTTPIMCVSLAIRMGAKKVIVWGCDMLTHHAFYEGSKRGNAEIALYKKFFEQCKKIGVEVYLGAHGTAFDSTLPLWTTAQ